MNAAAPAWEPMEARVLLDSTPVIFADTDLGSAVRRELGISDEFPVTVDDMATLEHLSADSNVIDSLDGLQYATGLQSLSLIPSDYSDPGHLLGADPLAPLSGLSSLEMVVLQRSGLEAEDLDSLGSPNALSTLDLRYNQIEHIQDLHLSELASLEELSLYGNPIEDISPLAGRLVRTDVPSAGAEQAQSIDELAAALHHMPARIYEYVLNHIEYEIYPFMMKPDQAVLETRRGNDWDTAALLASLLESRTPNWHWRFDETQGTTAVDATGRGSDGQVLSGEVTWLPGAGKIDGAVTLDGDDAAELDAPRLDQGDFTVAFWAQTGDDVHASVGAGWDGFCFQIDGGDVQVGTSYATRMAPVSQGGQLSGDLLSHGNWQHFAFSFEDGTGSLYVDGDLVHAQAGMDTPAQWTNFQVSSTAGAGQGTVSDDVSLDDLRVYDRAMKVGEVRDLASDAPAPYIITRHALGWIWVTPEEAQDWMGTTDPDAAFAALYYTGNFPSYDTDPETGEDLFEFRHCWLEANVIRQDRTHEWFQLAPSWKPEARQNGLSDMLQRVPFGHAERDEYLATQRPELPSEFYEEKVREYLAATDPSLTIADVPFDGSIVPQQLEDLPDALVFRHHQYASEGGHSVLFDTRNPGSEDAVDAWAHRLGLDLDYITLDAQGNVTSRTDLFEQDFRAFEICLSRLTISYESAGAGQVRPVLRIDGDPYFSQDLPAIPDSGVVELATQETAPCMTVPAARIYRRDVGEYIAVGLDALQTSPASLRRHRQRVNDATVAKLAGEPHEEDDLIGGLLQMGLLEYNYEANRAERRINDLTGSVPITPKVGSGLASASGLPEQPSEVEQLPYRFAPEDLFVDIKSGASTGLAFDLNSVSIDGDTVSINAQGIPEPVANGETEQRKALLGYTASAMEHRTWELLVNSPSMSTVKSLQVASEMNFDGQDSVLYIPPGDPDDCIQDLRGVQPLGLVDGEGRPLGDPLSSACINKIEDIVMNRDGTVVVPKRKTRLNDWYGVGYAAFMPNALSFAISGGLEAATHSTGEGGYTSGTTLTPVVPDDYGSSLTQATVGDPINIATGAVEHDRTDFSLPSLAGGMELSRHYTSRDTGARAKDHGFGDGWSFTSGDRLHFVTAADPIYPDLESDDIVWERGNGDLLEFRLDVEGYQTPDGVFGVFTQDAGGYLWEARDGREVRFDLVGKLLEARDRYGNGVAASYDLQGHLETVTDLRDPTRTVQYTWTGNHITSVQDHTDREWSYSYDANGRLIAVLAPAPDAQSPRPLTEYTYYTGPVLGDLLKTVAQPDGGVTTYRYYANRRGASVEDPAGNVHDLYYDLYRNRARFTDERGHETVYEYNEHGNPVLTVRPDGTTTRQTWQDNLLRSQTDEFGGTYTYEYDANGKLTSQTDPLGRVTRYEQHDGYGNPGRIVQPGGRRTTFEYDASGSLLSRTDALGQMTGYEHDAWGRRTRETSQTGLFTAEPDDHSRIYTHNAAGQVLTMTNGLGEAETYSYDSRGNLLSVTDANQHVSSYTYDALGRETSRMNGVGGTSTKSYDEMGNVISAVDPAGGETSFDYDAMQRLVRRTQADGTAVARDYDGVGNLVATTDELGRVTRHFYDALGREVSTLLPGGDVLQNEYDGGGRLVRETDALGNPTTYEYDAAGRVVRTTDALGRESYRVYAAGGELAYSASPEGPTAYTYDEAGRRTAVTYGFDFRAGVRFDFNAPGGATADGSIGVLPDTEYSDVRGYGWQQESTYPIESGTQDTDDPLHQDHHQSRADRTFRVDAPNGWYSVTVHLDAERDYVQVWSEDTLRLTNLDTAVGDFLRKTFLVEVLDGQLELEFRDTGGTNQRWGICAVEIQGAVDLRYDCAHEASHAVADDWSDLNRYQGWMGSVTPFDRVSGLDDLTRDGIGSTTIDGLFSMDVPDGWYTVTVHLGDTTPLAGVCVYAEDELAVASSDTATGALEYVARTFVVHVEDQQLNLRFTDEDATFGWAVVAMEIRGGIRLDLGSVGAVADGYVPLPAADEYSVEVGYGWDKSDGSYVQQTNRGGLATDDLTYDGHYSPITGAFRLDTPDGWYDVVAHFGHVTARDRIDVWAEGDLKLNDVSTLPWQFKSRRFPVRVEDGQLEIIFHDEGGQSAQWMVNALEVHPLVAQAQRRTAYDAEGNAIWKADELGNGTHYEYDQAGRRIAETDSLNRTQTTAYDPAGNPAIVTDALGHETRYELDGLNRVVAESRTAQRAMKFDFGRAEASFAAAGFVHVANAEVFAAGDDYGWEYAVQGVDRRVGDDLRRDCAYANGYDGVFHVTVPDGLYKVTTHLGDVGVRDLVEVSAEGLVKLQDITTAGYEYVALSFLVPVSDGDLALQFHDAGGDNGVWSVAGVEIDPVVRVDCDSPSLVTAEGYASFAAPRAYDPSRGYGWESATVGSLDRGDQAGDEMTRDGHNSTVGPGTLRLDVAPGVYTITAWLGDSAVRDNISLSVIEGGQPLLKVDGITTDAGEHTAVRFETEVLSGEALRIVVDDADDPGSGNYQWVLNGLEVLPGVYSETLTEYDPLGNVSAVTDALGNVTTYGYDGLGRRIGEVDPTGAETRTVFDAAGNIRSVTDARGGVRRYAYDQQDRLILAVDAVGGETHRTYDASGNVVSETDAAGHTMHYEYDELSRLVSERDPLGRTTHHRYNDEGRLESVTRQPGYSTYYEYDEFGRQRKVIEEFDGILLDCNVNGDSPTAEGYLPLLPDMLYTPELGYGWDAAVAGVTDEAADSDLAVDCHLGTDDRTLLLDVPAGIYTLIVQLGGPWAMSHVQVYVDEVARISSASVSAGDTEEYVLIVETGSDPLPIRFHNLYVSNLWSVCSISLISGLRLDNGSDFESTEPGFAPFAWPIDYTPNRGYGWTYDMLGNHSGGEDLLNSLGHKPKYSGSSQFRADVPDGWYTVRLHFGDCIQTEFISVYANGQRLVEDLKTEPYEYVVETFVAEAVYGKLEFSISDSTISPDHGWSINGIEILQGLPHQTTTEYDLAGNVVQVTDALGDATKYEYDALNRRITETDAEAGVTRTRYDGAGNVVEVIDAEGGSTTFAYDGMGRQVARTDALGHTTMTVYDASGQETARVDALGNETVREYDEAGRVSRVVDAQERATVFERDALGRTIRTEAAAGADLILHWALDEESGTVAADASGNGRNAQITGAAADWQPSNGRHAGALLMDGTYGVTASDLDFAPKAYTVAFWLKPTYLGASQRIGTGWGSFFLHTSGNGGAYIGTSAASRMTPESLGGEVPSGTFVVDDEWHHYAFTLDNGTAVLRKDGEVVATKADMDLPQPWQSFSLFADDGAALGVRGWVDDVRLYDAALSKAQLSDVMACSDYVTQTRYDAAGRVVQETDPRGHHTWYEYDPLGRVVAVTDALGSGPGDPDHTSHTEYDEVGNVILRTDALDHQSWYVYDAADRLVRSVDATGTGPDDLDHATTTRYDAFGNAIAVTDPLGHTTWHEYDLVGREVARTNARGSGPGDPDHTSRTEYDGLGNITRVTNELGHETLYTYDKLGRRLTETDALTHPTTWTYDAVGNVLSVTDARSKVTYYGYDPLGREVYVTNALGSGPEDPLHTSQTGYDEVGNVEWTRNALWQETRYEYDAFGRQTSVTDALEHTTKYRHDAAGNLVGVTDPLGNETVYAYDALGREILMTTPVGSETKTEYDAVGNVVRVTDPMTHVTEYAYDKLGRVTSVTNPFGSETTDYDAAGNVVRVTDRLTHETHYTYDELGREISVTRDIDGRLATTLTTYDRAGNVASVTDPVGNTTSYTYDKLNRMTHETTAAGTRTFGYDAVGHLTSLTDRTDRVTEYEYDAVGNCVEERWLDGAGAPVNTVEMEYDRLGRLTDVQDAQSRVQRSYDLVGRLSSVSNAGTPGIPIVSLIYTYDAAGRLWRITDTLGGITIHTYDAAGRRTRSVQDSADVVNKRVDLYYDAAGRLDAVLRYAGLGDQDLVGSSSYSYDAADRLTGLTHYSVSECLPYTYTYDAADRMVRMTTPDGVSEYAYDKTDQLTAADQSQHALLSDEAYPYDKNGNRIGGGYTVGAGNRLISDGTYTYQYDAEGNRILRTDSSGGVREYEWDHRNRLVRVVDRASAGGAAAQVVEFAYDGFDRRIAKWVDPDGDGAQAAKGSYFLYDGEHIAIEHQDTHLGLQFTYRYLHGPRTDQLLAAEDVQYEEILWPYCDHQGSVTDLIDSYGSHPDHIVYDSFGQVDAIVGYGLPFRFGYAGREIDREVDLHYYRARYYDPAVGRFLSENPIGFDAGDVNLYRYVGNNPLTHTDPSGLCPSSSRNLASYLLNTHGASPDPVTGLTDSVYSGLTSPGLGAGTRSSSADYSWWKQDESVTSEGYDGPVMYADDRSWLSREWAALKTGVSRWWKEDPLAPNADPSIDSLSGRILHKLSPTHTIPAVRQELIESTTRFAANRMIEDGVSHPSVVVESFAYSGLSLLGPLGITESIYGVDVADRVALSPQERQERLIWGLITTTGTLVLLGGSGYNPSARSFTLASGSPVVPPRGGPQPYASGVVGGDPTILYRSGIVSQYTGAGAQTALRASSRSPVIGPGSAVSGTMMQSRWAPVRAAVQQEVQFAKSFSALKRKIGAAGEGNFWHHVVEQRAANINRFGAEAIHNTTNVVAVPSHVNQTLANYYSTVQPFTKGQTVRRWLGSQSWRQQFDYGQKMLQKVLAGKPLP